MCVIAQIHSARLAEGNIHKTVTLSGILAIAYSANCCSLLQSVGIDQAMYHIGTDRISMPLSYISGVITFV